MGVKLYNSKSWLTKKYVHDRLSDEEIAKLAGATARTIRTKIKEFGLKR